MHICIRVLRISCETRCLQEPVLFATDIRTNICFGTPGASEEAVREAARAANAATFIERLPEGYHTQACIMWSPVGSVCRM